MEQYEYKNNREYTSSFPIAIGLQQGSSLCHLCICLILDEPEKNI